MSDVALKSIAPVEANRRLAGAAIAIFVIAVAFALAALVPGGTSYPDTAVIPFADWIGALFLWIKSNFTWLTRGLADIVDTIASIRGSGILVSMILLSGRPAIFFQRLKA